MRHCAAYAVLFVLSSLAPAAQMPAPAVPCPEGRAFADLSSAVARGRLYTGGNLFFGSTGESQYVVPIASGRSPIYAASLWLAGRVEDDVRAAAASYADFSFRPGLIGTDGIAPTPDECDAADRIWVVRRADADALNDGAAPTTDLASWPVHLGAPVADGDGVPGNWNPAGGDRPLLRGDVTAFWAMTDGATGPDRSPGGLPLGVDVTVEAFAFLSGRSELTSATFYRYTVTNRSGVTIRDLHAGFWTDFDLGDAGDDLIGTDTTHAMVFAYNADNDDSGGSGYGLAPPAAGAQVLEAPAVLERRLTASIFFIGGVARPLSDPVIASEFYQSLQGRWTDGTPMTEGGNGYQQTGPETVFAFPGDPVTGTFWSEVNPGGGTPNPGGDRRVLLGSGPLDLAPDSTATWLFATPYGRGASNIDSITHLRSAARLLETARDIGLFDATASPPVAPDPPPFAVAPPAPNPFVGSTTLRLRGLPDGVAFRLVARDALGRVIEDAPVVAGATAVEVGAGWAAGVYSVEVWSPAASARFRVVKVR